MTKLNEKWMMIIFVLAVLFLIGCSEGVPAPPPGPGDEGVPQDLAGEAVSQVNTWCDYALPGLFYNEFRCDGVVLYPEVEAAFVAGSPVRVPAGGSADLDLAFYNVDGSAHEYILYGRGYVLKKVSGVDSWVPFDWTANSDVLRVTPASDVASAASWYGLKGTVGNKIVRATLPVDTVNFNVDDGAGDSELNYVVSWVCQCADAGSCQVQDGWACNPFTADELGVVNGRWMLGAFQIEVSDSSGAGSGGAGSGGSGDADACASVSCEAGKSCVDGVCEVDGEAGSGDADACASVSCVAGESCVDGVCVEDVPAAGSQCGDGVKIATEGCDDGGVTVGDGCSATCTVEATHTCSENVGELSTCVQRVPCTVADAATVCAQNQLCDNGFCFTPPLGVNGESCTSRIGCESGYCDTSGATFLCAECTGNAQCVSGEICNQGVCGVSDRAANGVICNGGTACTTGFCTTAVSPFVCAACVTDDDCFGTTVCGISSGVCIDPGVCGNGVREASEVCDDGDRDDGDGCSSRCTEEYGFDCSESGVGLSQCSPVVLHTNSAACGSSAECASGYCDTTTDPSSFACQACTPGSTDQCGIGEVCFASGVCGVQTLSANGVLCGGSAECASGYCDTTGASFFCGACTAATATAPSTCGGGTVCDVTSGLCTAPAVCGDGVVTGTEGCDDRNTNDADGCSASCSEERGWACSELDATSESVCSHVQLQANGALCTGNGVCTSGFCDTSGSPFVCQSCDAGDCASGSECRAGACVPLVLGAVGDRCTGGGSCTSGYCDTTGASFVCAVAPAGGTTSGGTTSGGTTSGGTTSGGATSGGTTTGLGGSPITVCGNGVVEGSEACDDGNAVDGAASGQLDGCSADCLTVQPGFSCTDAGGVNSCTCTDGYYLSGCTAQGQACTTAYQCAQNVMTVVSVQ